MRIEIIVFAALAVLANAAPQWPYRDAVAPYYYGYPGKTPYMYRSGDEDDERDETYNLARQDLKVASSDGGSTVTVVEDDEKADGVQVVETGSAKPLKPVAQSANNNNQQQQDQQQPSATSQAQQPLSTNNANNVQQQTTNSGQPLTVQQPGQQPPAFPPARPPPRQRPAEEDEEEDEESEEEDEDAEDDEDEGDDDDDDDDEEEDDEDRRRDNIAQKEASSEEPAQQAVQEAPQASVAASEGSDEVVQEEQQPIVVEQPQQLPSQTQVLSNKVNKNKQSVAAAAAVPATGKNKKKQVASKVKPNSGAIEALVPGYVTDQGEVLVPVDTVTGSQPITIVPDPFSPPSRIVAGPRPIPQSAVPSTPSRQVPYWYRSSPAISPLTDGAGPLPRQTLYTPVPPPGSIFTFDDDDDDDEDDVDDSPSVVPGNRLRQDAEDEDEEDDDEDEEEDDRKKKAQPPQKVPLAAVQAATGSGEDDEAEALAFINSGRPVPNKKPPTSTSTGGNKKPAAGKPDSTGSNESESEEGDSAEDDISNEDEEDEEDDYARGESPAQIAANPLNRGRMYVDEDLVSFPPSRSPAIFAVIQGKFPGQVSQRHQQSQIFSTPNPGNPYQRFVVRVTPSNKPGGRPQASPQVYYRPPESRPPNRRVVPVASFDVSVEDTRPTSAGFDSEEDNESISIGGPTQVSSYPFVYKVQGSLSGLRVPTGGGPHGAQALAALLGGRRPPVGFYGASFGPPGGSRPPRPGPSGPYPGPGYRPRPPYSFSASFYGSPSGSPYGSPYGPRPSASSHSFGPRRPSGGPGQGPPIIVRRKQPGGGPNRPPKPHLIAVYNPSGSPSAGPREREPVEEEYYTFEVPEHNNKIIATGGPSKNKRPTVHRKPTPVIHQKLVSEDEENSDEQSPVPSPPKQIQFIPQGTVRRRIRGGKQLKPKKNSKKTVSANKKQQQQDQQDPLGLLSKVNKSKTKMH